MMNSNLWSSSGFGAGLFGAWMGIFLVPLMFWGLAWKGWALWKASKNDSKVWFIVLLLVNTIGILDILYIFVFSKKIGTAHKKAKK
jgi:hypothetical protein